MGPTWIVVIVRDSGEVSVEEFRREPDARERYAAASKEGRRTVCLATVKEQAS